MSGALGDDSDPTFTHFAHRSEFLDLLKRFLDLDLRRDPDQREDEEEVRLLDQLGAILDYYLPLPGLLDPSLHEIVPPLMEVLTVALNSLISDAPEEHISAARLQRLGRVIQWVVKVRGWKAIVTYLPSSISNLPTLIRLLSPPNTPSTSSSPLTPHHPSLSGQEAWEVRAILLLWLSILLTVPFDLSALSTPSFTLEELASLYPSFDKVSIGILFRQDVSEITAQVILLSLPLLHNPGKEATYAALVLARLYSRSDAAIYLESFFEWARMELEEGDRENEAHFVSALFEFLAILPGLLAPEHLGRLEWFTTDVLLPHLRGSRTTASSGLVRKLAVKARGRWWVAKLGHTVHKGNEDVDMPEGLEEELDDLMNGLSDKDTIVRYSCAKYLARLSSVLPSSLAEQIMLATIALFGGTKDEPVISTDFGVVVDPGGTASTGGTMGFGGAETTRGEARWHGCCLAIAEMARRGLITDTKAISQAVDWVLKAMTFDLRRSSYSIGANVRDAAAYLVWSLSRACPAATLEPHVNELATALTCVACFDREVGVRRAASAAFQEGVGRLGLYPDGIDVLGKTDFYSVSVRRIAFKTAAPAVARHDVYRRRMREHLHQITLRHWDVTMRNLAANALKDVLTLASDQDIQDSIDREIKQIPSLDPVNVHGALVALSAMCQLLNENDERRKKVLHSVSAIRPAALVSTQGAEIVQAACDLITASISLINIDQPILNDLVHHNLDLAMKRRESDCYEAAARMIGRVSELKPANREVERLLQMMTSPRAVPKQIAALALGHVKYAGCPDKLDVAVKALLAQGDVVTNADVETRRYAIRSLARILAQRNGDETLVSNDQFAMAYDFFSRALDDYSTDQRGDVGSWIRVAGLLALGQAISIASQKAEPKFWVSQDMLETALRGIIKLGMEKLEPVRAAAWRSWGLLRTCRADQTWEWIGNEVWSFDVKDESDESFRYIELRSWYTSAMPLLVTQYRAALISGIANSIGSQVESVASVALDSLKAYLTTQAEGSLITAISKDLQKIISAGVNQNRIFIPTTMTITKLVADDKLCQSLRGQTAAPIGSIVMTACRGIPQLKSIERITVSMKLVVTCLGVFEPTVQNKAIDNIALFLGHRFPRIRAMTSEALYLKLSEIHDDELDPQLENLLLETEWTDESVGMSEAEVVVCLLRGMSLDE